MMRMSKRILALTMVVSLSMAALAGCGDKEKKKENEIGGKDSVFTIAYAPNESTDQSSDARNGLAKDLGKYLGCEVEEIQASDYNAIIEALRTGKADMAYMGANAIALGYEKAGIEPITMKAEDGDPKKAVYQSYLITSASNNKINSMKDIKGCTIAFVDPDSTSGNLVPTSDIITAFPDEKLNSDKLHTNGEFFEAASYSGSHQAGLQAVIRGDVDIVPISNQILESEIANGNAKESDVKIIHKSDTIPAEAMVVSPDISDEIRAKLVKFLVAYDNQAYFTEVIKKENARFIKCSIEDYKSVITLNKVLNGE